MLSDDNVNELIEQRAQARWANFVHSGSQPMDPMAGGRGLDPTDLREVQQRLSAAGLYDRAAIDGEDGPFTRWALDELKKLAGAQGEPGVGPRTLDALKRAEEMLPLEPGNDFAGRIVRAMQDRGYWICRHPQCVNIVYVEGMNTDGSANDNTPNQFNDARILLSVRDGVPGVVAAWEGSTEPGRLFTENPVEGAREKGAARIQFGQYYAWRVGSYHDQEALLRQMRLRFAGISTKIINAKAIGSNLGISACTITGVTITLCPT